MCKQREWLWRRMVYILHVTNPRVLDARMLEAAMLGIPYEGRMPHMGEPWQPSAPPAPEVVAQRQLREEQDVAYQASLLVSPSRCSAVSVQPLTTADEVLIMLEQFRLAL